MNRRALINKNRVVNIIQAGPNFKVEGHDIIDITEQPGVHIGDTYANGAFSRPVQPAANADQLKAHLANERWKFETSGVVWNGYKIDTSRESQAMLTSVAVYASRKGNIKIDFKTLDGFVSIETLAIGELTRIVSERVQDAFAKEAAATLEIDAGTITTFREIDAKFAGG